MYNARIRTSQIRKLAMHDLLGNVWLPSVLTFQLFTAKAKREVDPDLVCTNCRPKLRCSRCGEGYEDAYWPRAQKLQHLRLQTKLVCKPCRAQGFHARDVVSYICQSCKGKFGSRKSSRASLAKSWRNNCKTLKCKQCVAATKETKKAALTSGAAVAAAENDG